MRASATLAASLVVALVACADDDSPADGGAPDASAVLDLGIADLPPAEDARFGDAGALATWHVTPTSIYAGQYATVGDPSVLRDETGTYRMYHQCLDVERTPQGSEICLAESNDGLSWTSSATSESSALVQGRLLRAVSGSWDEAHETPFARRAAGLTSLYVVGYRGAAFGAMPPSSIGRSTSADGVGFSAVPAVPMFSPTATGSDAYGITSPSIAVRDDGTEVLYYTGWCLAPFACPRGSDPFRLTLLAATSNDGASWTPHAGVLVGDPGLSWTNGGISEAEVVRGPDGRYFLFFSSLSGPKGSPTELQRIGIAVASDPFGPFTFSPEPIVSPEPLGAWADGGVLAPSVLFEGSRVRMWFHAFERDSNGAIMAARIGYAESTWPLGL